jgi:hypothetical protein
MAALRLLSSGLKLGLALPCMALWWASLLYLRATPRERRLDPILVAQGLAQLSVGLYLLVSICAGVRTLVAPRRLDKGGEERGSVLRCSAWIHFGGHKAGHCTDDSSCMMSMTIHSEQSPEE